MTDEALAGDTPGGAGGQRPPSPPPFHGVRRFQSNPHLFMHALFEAYGDIVCWRGFKPVYLVNHPDYARKVLAQSHEHYSKQTIDYRVIAQTMGKGLVTNDGPDWVRQRRLMQPMFSARNVNAFDAPINALTTARMEDWQQRHGDGPLWIEREMADLTFQIVAATLFGSDAEPHAAEMAEILEIVNLHTQELRALLTLYPWIPTPYNRRWKRAVASLDRIVYGMIAARRRAGAGDADLLDRLLGARDEVSGEAMPEQQIRDEVVTLMLAGHETSANALAWTLYLLATHPEIDQRLASELDAALGGAPAQAADLARVPYLKQVVQEAMRIYPPVWAVARRSEHDDAFGPYRVPARSYVGVPIWVLHRHPAFWPEPERFDPDRFAAKRGESRHSYCYLPFAAGPRTCIGAGMATLEIQLILAQIVQRFRAAPVPGHPVETIAKVTLKPRHGMPLTLTPR